MWTLFVLRVCNCGTPITIIRHFTKEDNFTLESSKTIQIQKLSSMLKDFFIPITNGFSPMKTMTILGHYLIIVVCKRLNEYNMRSTTRAQRYIIWIFFSFIPKKCIFIKFQTIDLCSHVLNTGINIFLMWLPQWEFDFDVQYANSIFSI